ncbi:MAG: pyrroline-5-carboxylate reductase [Treponema sp.]|nr:pyrroline-5-carboxylate reductase [Treponema sp.]MCI7565733.1 pyrroline-5-carboxylate reductase [Treponema sp.]
MKISCIGTGAMGGAIMRAICKKYDVKNIKITDKNVELGKAFANETGATFVSTNKEVLDADYIFLAVKPQFLSDVFAEIAGNIPTNAVVISMAAGVKLEKLENWAPKARFVRMMPNVCAQIGQAMIAITYNENIKAEEAATVKEILSSAGKVEQVPEKLMDCVTAVSGSGPAFVFMFIEALADAAVRCGMPRSQAYTYAAQTVYGSAGMVLENGQHPAVLKDMVCSPAGTTIEGVAALEKNNFRNAVIEAVTAACDRSIALGK